MMSPSYVSLHLASLFLPRAVGRSFSRTFTITSSRLLALKTIVIPPTKRVLILSFIALLLCDVAHAQSTASIEGQVIHPNGAVLAAVEIIAASLKQGIVRVGATDGNVVGSPAFGRITNTRFHTGESGSSRQIQFAMRLMFQGIRTRGVSL